MDPSPQTKSAPIIPVASFIKNLLDSGLLPSEEVQAIAAATDQYADGKQLALDLVKQQKLTLYQATMIYQGKRGLLLGRYVILDKLGQGGMGMVYKARQKGMGRIVAIKVLPPAVCKNPGMVQRFQREVQAAAQLNHSNIVRAYDADNSGSVHFLVMEHVDGTDLSRLVKANGPLSVSQAVTCIVQAARGLAAAHAAGVVHRDIKPGNLLLDSKGTVKILDMGLARFDAPGVNSGGDATAPDELTKSGSILGTTDYMAPEQAVNTKKADQRADIYSLGCTLHYLLTGQPMFSGETPMEKLLAHREADIPSLCAARPEVPEAVDAVYQRMVAKKPADRYQTMDEVATELQASLADEGKRTTSLKKIAQVLPPSAPDGKALDETMAEIASSTATSLRRQRSQPRSRKVRWLLGGGVAAAGLLLVVVIAVSAGRKPSAGRQTSPDPSPSPVAGPIFNGKDLTGWVAASGGRDQWSVTDGVLSTTGSARGWLLTEKPYANFELRLEYRLFKGSDSGVSVRTPFAGNPVGHVGIQINLREEASNLQHPPGSINGVPALASAQVLGAWNRLFVRIVGPHLTVELNDKKTLDIDLTTLEGKPNAPNWRAPTGAIGLESWAGRVEFRKVLLTPLPSSTPPPPAIEVAWVERAERQSGAEQVATVSKKMSELNPGFNGQLGPQYEGNRIIGLQFPTDFVSDIRPLKVFKDLRSLKCSGSGAGKGLLSDLGPLRGLRLTNLECVYNLIHDLKPLQDMPLTYLECGGNAISDLAPLRGMRLTHLNCSQSLVRDLAPIRDMPLVWLLINQTQVTDLAPLQGLPLKHLRCYQLSLKNLQPLAGLPLEDVDCSSINTSDLSPLRKCPIRNLNCDCPLADGQRRLEELPTLRMLNGTLREVWYVLPRTRPIPRWNVLQPLPRQSKEPFDVTVRGGELAADEFKRTYVGLDDRSVSWKELVADAGGIVPINPVVPNAILIAYATMQAAADRDVEILLAQDDDIVVWLNGQKIFERRGPRGFSTSDVVRARLRKGANHFLVRCENGGGAWNFGVRVTD